MFGRNKTALPQFVVWTKLLGEWTWNIYKVDIHMKEERNCRNKDMVGYCHVTCHLRAKASSAWIVLQIISLRNIKIIIMIFRIL